MIDSGPLLQPATFGQGSYGTRCEVCLADDYLGPIVHREGCVQVTKLVRMVREGEGAELAKTPAGGSG